jgi:hypothetical protein
VQCWLQQPASATTQRHRVGSWATEPTMMLAASVCHSGCERAHADNTEGARTCSFRSSWMHGRSRVIPEELRAAVCDVRVPLRSNSSSGGSSSPPSHCGRIILGVAPSPPPPRPSLPPRRSRREPARLRLVLPPSYVSAAPASTMPRHTALTIQSSTSVPNECATGPQRTTRNPVGPPPMHRSRP